MALKMISVKCPQCGADLEYEEGRKTLFCQYCGAKVLVQNDNEYVYRTIDDAEVERAKTERMMREQQLELEREKMQNAERKTKLKIKLSIVLGVIGAVLLFGGWFIGNASNNPNSSFYMLSLAGIYAILAIPLMWMIGKKRK